MNTNRGRQYMAVSVLFSFLAGLGVKLAANLPPIEIVFFNALVSLIIGYSTLRYQGLPVWGHYRQLLILRGSIGLLGIILFSSTLQNMPLASAITIQYTSPIFTTLLSIFIVKETIKPLRWLFFVLSFVGVVCIKGFDANTPFYYVFLGTVAALCRGIAHNLVRRIQEREHPLVVMFYATVITVVVTGPYLLFYQFVIPTSSEYLMLACMGSFSYLSHYCMVKSYQLAPVAQLASISYTSVIYALIVGYGFLQETLSPLAIVGIGMVLVGVLLDLMYKQKTCKAIDEVAKKKR